MSLCLVKKEKTAYLQLKIGKKAFMIKSVRLKLEEKTERVLEHVGQDWGMTNCRILNPAISRRRRKLEKPPLSDILAGAVSDEILHDKRTTNFLKGEGNVPYWSPFKPMATKVGSLRIPVDFIAVHHFGRGLAEDNGPVRAHISVGHYLLFWDIQIFDGKRFGYDRTNNSIRDERVIEVINRILARKNLRSYVRQLSASGRKEPRVGYHRESTPGYESGKKVSSALRIY